MPTTLAETQIEPMTKDRFLAHYKMIRAAEGQVEEAKMQLVRLKKAAKHDGCSLDALKMLERLYKLELDERELLLRQTEQYATWLTQPLGTQAAMFPDQVEKAPPRKSGPSAAEVEAGDAGYMAGKNGQLREENPFLDGSASYAQWDKMWLRGVTVVANELQAKYDMGEDEDASGLLTQVAALRESGEIPTPPTVRRRGRGKAQITTETTH